MGVIAEMIRTDTILSRSIANVPYA